MILSGSGSAGLSPHTCGPGNSWASQGWSPQNSWARSRSWTSRQLTGTSASCCRYRWLSYWQHTPPCTTSPCNRQTLQSNVFCTVESIYVKSLPDRVRLGSHIINLYTLLAEHIITSAHHIFWLKWGKKKLIKVKHSTVTVNMLIMNYNLKRGQFLSNWNIHIHVDLKKWVSRKILNTYCLPADIIMFPYRSERGGQQSHHVVSHACCSMGRLTATGLWNIPTNVITNQNRLETAQLTWNLTMHLLCATMYKTLHLEQHLSSCFNVMP